ncbi:uncharacterized protein HHUB_2568 [Halobacterium hubeiense]|uniref:LppX domain protein n=1 Tax=Halobacterium hubeiense TaxID=1407499 RepID=A0A0U5H754_9EURY|nr:hypothetical protein [Halobacterium hubeiense]CQH57604.1 uncharacterized protein HHUB_2568 [Halobacterium hubeiense]
MRRPVLTVLVCALLVASAGCAGVLGGDQTTDSATTQRPTTDSPTETASAERLAPGVTTEEVTDALALVDAHRESLRSGSFVKHAGVEWTNSSENGSRRATFQYDDESHWNWTRAGVDTYGLTNGTLGLYADGERVLSVIAGDGNASYGVRRVSDDAGAPPIPPAELFPSSVYDRDLLYTLFGSDNVTVERGDDAAARVSGTIADVKIGEAAAENVEFDAAVTADGVVRSLDLSYERFDRSVERTVTFEQSTGDPVERPDWYSEASNGTA